MDKTARTPSTRTKRRSCPKLQRPDVRPGPDVRRLPGSGRPAPSGRPCQRPPNRICGHPKNSGRPGPREPPDDRPPPDVRPKRTRAESTEVRRAPNVRTFPSLRTTGTLRTSDACLRTVCWAAAHVPLHLPLRGPRLYILLHLLLVRFSVDLAQVRDRASLIHRISSS